MSGSSFSLIQVRSYLFMCYDHVQHGKYGKQMLNKGFSVVVRYNGIKDLATLQLGRLSSLKALFLQGTVLCILID